MEKQHKKLILMRAAPGSGKSTWVRDNILSKFPNAVVCSADDFFIRLGNGEYIFESSLLFAAHNQCFRRARKAMERSEMLIVIDNTNIKRRDYERYVECAKENGYMVYQKVVDGNFNNVHGVPDEKVNLMKKNFEIDDNINHWPSKDDENDEND